MSSPYEPDFIERNGTWLLSVMGIVSACGGGLLAYMIRSRCTKIKCCGMECDRQPIDLTATDLQAMENGNSSTVQEVPVRVTARGANRA